MHGVEGGRRPHSRDSVHRRCPGISEVHPNSRLTGITFYRTVTGDLTDGREVQSEGNRQWSRRSLVKGLFDEHDPRRRSSLV